jgi:hypothetical protein
MRIILIIPLIALFSIVIGTVGSEYYVEYSEKYELENLIISCMEKYGHYSDELISCLNDDLIIP